MLMTPLWQAFAAGEIRGQVIFPSVHFSLAVFPTLLYPNGTFEVPAADTTASGAAAIIRSQSQPVVGSTMCVCLRNRQRAA
jgi:hypothetical protein